MVSKSKPEYLVYSDMIELFDLVLMFQKSHHSHFIGKSGPSIIATNNETSKNQRTEGFIHLIAEIDISLIFALQ